MIFSPSSLRSFLAPLRRAVRSVAGYAMRLAAWAVNATARAVRWVVTTIGAALAPPAAVDRTAIGAAVVALVLLVGLAVVVRALVQVSA